MGNLDELNHLINTGQNDNKHRHSKLTYPATDIATRSTCITRYYPNNPHCITLPEFDCTVHTNDQTFIVRCRRQQLPH
jgi:hypothetical protein